MLVLRYVLCHVFCDSEFGRHGLNVGPAIRSEEEGRHEVVDVIAVASKPESVEFATPRVLGDFPTPRREQAARKKFSAFAALSRRHVVDDFAACLFF